MTYGVLNRSKYYGSINFDGPDLDLRSMRSQVLSRWDNTVLNMDTIKNEDDYVYYKLVYNELDKCVYILKQKNEDRKVNITFYKYDTIQKKMSVDYTTSIDMPFPSGKVTGFTNQCKDIVIKENTIYLIIDYVEEISNNGSNVSECIYHSYLYKYECDTKNLQKILDLPKYDLDGVGTNSGFKANVSFLGPIINNEIIYILGDSIYYIDLYNYIIKNKFNLRGFPSNASAYALLDNNDDYYVIMVNAWALRRGNSSCNIIINKQDGKFKQVFPNLQVNIDNIFRYKCCNYKQNFIFELDNSSNRVDLIVVKPSQLYKPSTIGNRQNSVFSKVTSNSNLNRVYSAMDNSLVSLGNDEFILFTTDEIFKLSPPV